ncbi:MAG TPA: ABC transporter ATP-binding protein, partial [Lachnospiraceae bacterium]|nr:ABC transporter ATP-binding protein [Lachnospiraceae bacterium]
VCPFCTIIIGINRIISALIPSLTVLITANFVDTAMNIYRGEEARSHIFTPLILYMLIILYSYTKNAFIFNFVNIRYDMKIFRFVRRMMVEKRGRLEYRHIENNDSWDLITRTCNNALGKIAAGMNNLFDGAELIIRIGSVLLILTTQVWWVGLLVLVITIPLLFLAAKGGKEIYKANQEAQKHERRATYLQEVLTKRDYVEERSLFGYTDHVNEKWHEKFEISRKINLKVQLKNFIRMKGSSILTIGISLLIIGVLLYPLSKKAISIGMFMGLTSATLDLVHMMSWRLAYVTRTWAENLEYLKDLTAFMALSEREGATDLPSDTKELSFDSIEFRNVSFKYPDTEKYILKDFNLKIMEGLHYAFVGINGAGKTTITKLLTGMYDNYEGEILINGESIRSYPLSKLKALFSVVYQDFAKYSVTLKDNIILGNVLDIENGTVDEGKVAHAADNIGLGDEIAHLPNGMDTYLGKIKEGGMDLSGGQWQRLAVARTIYNPALVRILDEPTAALDPVAESSMYEMFGDISKGETTIFITHRLGAAKLADEIIVLDEGRVVEQGNHDTLLSLGGIYSEMFESQRSWYSMA